MMVSLSSMSFQSYSCIVMDLSICWGDYDLITPFMTNQSLAGRSLADVAGTLARLTGRSGRNSLLTPHAL